MTINPESVKKLLSSEEVSDRLRGLNQLRQLEPAIAFELVQLAIGDKNTRVRYSAVSQMDTLGKQDLEKALSILRSSLLHDSEIDVQAAAADAIGALKLGEAFEDLRQAYRNTSEWLLQLSIVAALGEMGDPRSFDLLTEALGSSIDLVQTAAISSFGELGDLRAVPLLAPYATHPDWQIRYRLVQSLKHLGSPEALVILEKMTDDEVEQVAEEAKNSLPLA
ncbi:phycobilisome degradation protein NblB [Argonema galeatum]|uniref:phycobilisome degradation protein NblB n=1 Tax=Argonema galeatum TaxID=2942762 RepID=UPI0020131523|nr:HEAT repeat domain-containing protein [Argonema galeatum]MCL1467446.1 HEAT repeat domain-containing protein [Argonema galeatum A003/A1]